MKKFLIPGILGTVGFIFTFMAVFFVFYLLSFIRLSSREDLISCKEQPTYFETPFCVRLITSNYLFTTKREFFITVGKDNPYGLAINHPESISDNTKDPTKVEWLDTGVKIITPLGYEIFIKKDDYMKGR